MSLIFNKLFRFVIASLGSNYFSLRTLNLLPKCVLEYVDANEKFGCQSESFLLDHLIFFPSRKLLFILWMMKLFCFWVCVFLLSAVNLQKVFEISPHFQLGKIFYYFFSSLTVLSSLFLECLFDRYWILYFSPPCLGDYLIFFISLFSFYTTFRILLGYHLLDL